MLKKDNGSIETKKKEVEKKKTDCSIIINKGLPCDLSVFAVKTIDHTGFAMCRVPGVCTCLPQLDPENIKQEFQGP